MGELNETADRIYREAVEKVERDRALEEAARRPTYKPDPRNPKVGERWTIEGRMSRSVDRVWESVVFYKEGSVLDCCSLHEWRRWACPWFRRRKHWAKCVEWKQ